MAYSDYGAFVYKNGIRRHDKEDVGVYEENCDLPSSARIYANLAKRLLDDAAANNTCVGCYHAVLGDGDVRVSMYKEGVGKIWIYDSVSDEIKEINAEQIVKHCLGDAYANYIEFDKNACPDNASDAEKESYYNRNDTYYQQFNGPYSYEFEYNGYKIRFQSKGISDEDENISVYPRYSAEMLEPDGTCWKAFYDVSYGAGITDTDGAEHRFDFLDEDGNAPEHRVLNVTERTTSLYDEEHDVFGDLSLILDSRGNIMYRGEELFLMTEDGGEASTHSTEWRNSYIIPSDYIDILNRGIALAKQGIDEVSSCSSSFGGRIYDLDDYHEADCPMWMQKNNDSKKLEEIRDGFRKFHKEVFAKSVAQNNDMVEQEETR